MNITEFSRNRMMQTAKQWDVSREYFDPLYNYLVFGFVPGGFWTAVLANDFMSAIQRSHPSNRIEALKSVTGWIEEEFPAVSYGSYQMVRDWLSFTDLQRRSHLEAQGLIYTEQEEIMRGLKGERSQEPILY